MKKLAIIFLLWLFTLTIFSQSEFKIKKDIKVLPDEIIDYSIVSFGGKIEIEGQVNGSIILLGGEIILKGEVSEDVVCFASKVKVSENAKISGDLIAMGGQIDKEAKNKVKGDFFFFKFNLKKIENTLFPNLSDSKTIFFIRAVRIILLLLIALIVLAVVPQKITRAAALFEPNILKIGATGIFSFFSALTLLLIFIVMSFVIIGIPFLFLLIILYFGIFIFGRTVMLFYIGTKLSTALKLKKITPALFIVIGITFYTLLRFLPVVGPLILIIMNVFEIGIGTAFILRKKISLIGYSPE